MTFVADKAGLIAATALAAGFQQVSISPCAAVNALQSAGSEVATAAASTVTTVVPDGAVRVVQIPAPVSTFL